MKYHVFGAVYIRRLSRVLSYVLYFILYYFAFACCCCCCCMLWCLICSPFCSVVVDGRAANAYFINETLLRISLYRVCVYVYRLCNGAIIVRSLIQSAAPAVVIVVVSVFCARCYKPPGDVIFWLYTFTIQYILLCLSVSLLISFTHTLALTMFVCTCM